MGMLRGSPLISRLVLPVIFMFVVGAATIFGLAVVSAWWQDEGAATESKRIVDHALEEAKSALAVLAKDYTWWNEPITHLYVEFDPGYADRDFGVFLTGQHNAAAVFLLDADGREIYGRIGETVIDTVRDNGTGFTADPELRALFEQAMASKPEEPVPATGLVPFDSPLVDDRSEPVLADERIADGQPLGLLDQLAHQHLAQALDVHRAARHEVVEAP